MNEQVVVAVDIGTSSTKAAIVDREGKIHSVAAVEYPLLTPAPGIAEQDPDVLLEAVVEAVSKAVAQSGFSADALGAVSFSAAMHSLIAVDDRFWPLTRCITWADNRGASYVQQLYEQHDGKSIYMRTGTPIHPMSPLLKIMWLRDHQPDIFRRTSKFIGIKEYVFAKMCGKAVIDYSLASAAGLFHLELLQWDEQALATAGITADRLSEPVSPAAAISGFKQEYAARMGLKAGTPFVVGASDGVLANLGIGATDPGTYAVTIGTSGAVRAVVPRPLADPQARLFCYALAPSQWVIGEPINNGGVLFRWVRDELATLEAEQARSAGQDPYEALSALAAEVQPGSDGLLVLPLFTGERAPYWNANARGVFFGLTLYHSKAHMIRAVMEGVIYAIHSVAKALEELAGAPERILASGGFARSPLWCQMMADVLGAPVVVPKAYESSAIGAAILGFAALDGENPDTLASFPAAGEDTRYEPDAARHKQYRRLSALYEKVYNQLIDTFDEISDIQKGDQE